MGQWITPEEAARRLGVSRSYMTQLLGGGLKGKNCLAGEKMSPDYWDGRGSAP